MTVQEGLFYIGGTICIGFGMHLSFGTGPGLISIGVLFVLLSVCAEWENDLMEDIK